MFVGSNERGEAFQNVIIPYWLLNWLHSPRGSSQSLFLRFEPKALYPMPVYPASQKSLLCNAGYLLEFRVGMFLCPSQGGGGKRRLSLEKVFYSLTEWNTVRSACTLVLPRPWRMLSGWRDDGRVHHLGQLWCFMAYTCDATPGHLMTPRLVSLSEYSNKSVCNNNL